jgi:hypothetical protein
LKTPGVFRSSFCPACCVHIDRFSVEIREPDAELIDGRAVGRRKLSGGRAFTNEDLQNERFFTCDLGHKLPTDFFETKCVAIAFVGPTMSMKSHLIISTAQRIIDDAALERISDSTLVSASLDEVLDPEVRQNMHRLATQLRVLDRTLPKLNGSPIRSPVSIRLKPISDRPFALLTPSYLMLFDAAGEKLTRAQDPAKVAPYITNASAIVLLVDPTQIVGVRE